MTNEEIGMSTAQLQELSRRIHDASAFLPQLRSELGRTVLGQEKVCHDLCIALLADGHVLLEGAPGLAKTTAVRALAHTIQASFQRIQFTPDLLPADILGTQIYRPQTGTFEVRQGPIFGHLVLADEINRAPAKVQSALLEAMQERQVTIAGQTFTLPKPFFVLATQNPIEQEGTYPLPEAQVDRFLLKVDVTYPSRDAELQVLQLVSGPGLPTPRAVATPEDLCTAQALVREVFMDPRVQAYIVDLVRASRGPSEGGLKALEGLVRWGASPRASIALALCAKAQAFLDGRAFATPDDVKAVARAVLRHRLGLSYEAQAENTTPEDVVEKILSGVIVP
jgi:MoxR-like ATPase